MFVNKMRRNYRRRFVNEELTKNDVSSIFSDRMSSTYKSREFEKAVREISAEVITDLFKTLWQRDSSWKSGVRK